MMINRVYAYIAAESGREIQWNVTDCVSTADRWIEKAAGISPKKHSGLVWKNEKQAFALAGGENRVPRFICRIMARAGFEPTHNPASGDVAVIKTGGRAAMAILADDTWFWRDNEFMRGIARNDAQILRAWRIECP